MQDSFESRRKYHKFICKEGMVFGRLTLTGVQHSRHAWGQRRRFVEAKCVCGDVKDYVLKRLLSGETQSCGCLRKDVSRERMTTHGQALHPLYDVRLKMMERCYNTEDPAYKNYGGRGIEVWADWHEFTPFYEWAMANGYEEGKMLDRTDNDGHYAPYNCAFVTRAEQNRNKRSTRMYTAFGETKCLFDWGEDPRCKISVWGLRNRMDRGKWTDFQKALTTPETSRQDIQRNNKRNVNLTAFGETKCMTAWLEDSRCKVKIDSLRDRLAKGWLAQKALSEPPTMDKNKYLTAFGETKSRSAWLEDSRCKVKLDGLRDRLAKGWSAEKAMSEPPTTR